MEIFLNKRTVRQLRLSASDAIDDGDTETLREDLVEVFTEHDVDELERRIDCGDVYEFVSIILDEWTGEDVDELFELLEEELSNADIGLRYADEDEGEDEEEGEEEEDEDEDDVDVDEVDDDEGVGPDDDEDGLSPDDGFEDE